MKDRLKPSDKVQKKLNIINRKRIIKLKVLISYRKFFFSKAKNSTHEVKQREGKF